MYMTCSSYSDGFDIVVSDCFAHNGGNKRISLIDHYGWVRSLWVSGFTTGEWGHYRWVGSRGLKGHSTYEILLVVLVYTFLFYFPNNFFNVLTFSLVTSNLPFHILFLYVSQMRNYWEQDSSERVNFDPVRISDAQLLGTARVSEFILILWVSQIINEMLVGQPLR